MIFNNKEEYKTHGERFLETFFSYEKQLDYYIIKKEITKTTKDEFTNGGKIIENTGFLEKSPK